jgi:hypothetical protein
VATVVAQKSLKKLLASLIAQLWRHLLFLYILKDVCEEHGNWISTFLIKLFLIHGCTTTGKFPIPWYDAKGQAAYFLAMSPFLIQL